MSAAVRWCALGFGLLLMRPILAQDVREVDGKKFRAHTVEAGQTLFALSRHYAVPVDALLAANPAAASGLSIGQVVLVPLAAVNKKELRTAPALQAGELVHRVAKKETLYGIAKRYGVDLADVMARNPELSAGLQDGGTVVIPVVQVRDVSAATIAPATSSDATMHLVQVGETLFALGQRYGMPPDSIVAHNGGLPAGLKAGQYVRIPAPPKVVVVEPAETKKAERYRIGLLLPLALDANDSVHKADPNRKGLYEVTSIAAQFHCGVRMALDSLADQGLRAEVLVYDLGEDARTWGPVLRKQEIRDIDLFLGPFHRSAIDQLAATARGGHIVCPVPQSNKLILGHRSVSKVLSGRPDQLQHLARYAASTYARENIVLLRPDIPSEKELQAQMLRALQEALRDRPDRLRDSVLVARPGQKDLGNLTQRLDPLRENIIMVPSEDVEFVSGLITKLIPMQGKFRIKVFGLAAWNSMEVIEPGDLDKLHVHVPMATFVDYEDPRVQRFVRAFRERFTADAGPYAFLGFDIAYFYGTALMQEGRSFEERFDAVATQPLHMGFRLKRMGQENGFGNESSVVLEYRDLGLHRVR
ncbi:MAG: LysM peptidoglycan-binding domain-containing protein [Flavobacteriales bacterium]|nr:LysM peptidoglycan-binding domain-containing protein [Flavobacteriales bacterium]MBK9075598.1 LysM peptidoglycan-binding domain-containing protein [Flavobacteriales bacterium]MBK9537628.1 LysM peptidoglycan-binding domain-containing protein [Flavobacteriales bacterium]